MQKKEILEIIQEEDVRFVSLWFTDITGIVKSVLIPQLQIEAVLENGSHFDGSSIDGFARVAESDMVLIPDLDTFCVLPWTTGANKTARLICTVRTRGTSENFVGDPRTALLRVARRAEDSGYNFRTSVELEFFLFRLDEKQRPILEHANDNASYFDIPDDPIRSVRRQMLATLGELGIPAESTHSEIGLGQHEIVLPSEDILTTADNILTARIALKTIAQHYGLYCTFMPRPSSQMPGSGLHTKQSLHDVATGENVFGDELDEYGLSETAKHFLAGQLAHAKAMSAVLSPLVNSYKRLGTSVEAPTAVTWARVNRASLIRVPSVETEKTHLELRCPDPSSNPYLAGAVMLEAGMDGMKFRLPLPEPMEETLMTHSRGRIRNVSELPRSLGEALDCLRQDDTILSALGPYLSDRFLIAKQQEFNEYMHDVSNWELERYLNRF